MALRPVAHYGVVPLPQVRRRTRSPTHPWFVRHKPFDIQPFCLVPVLAGDTLKNLTFQARAVTDPIKAALVGWHLEHFWFYVKVSQISRTHQQMVLDPIYSVPVGERPETILNHYSSALAGAGGIRWLKWCYTLVCQEWFYEDAQWTGSPQANGLFAAQRSNKDVFDSVLQGTVSASSGDFDVEGSDANTTIQVSEVEAALNRWRLAKMNNLTNLTYEEYLVQQGAPADLLPGNVDYRPELIRFQRQWQYPSNTVNPATGIPSSAVSWSIADRADKDRRFSEPGFIIGVTIARPKVYVREQRALMAQHIANAYHWQPQQLDGDGRHTWVEMGDAVDTLVHTSTIAFDTKDLFLRGEQFTNIDLTVDTEAARMQALTMSVPGGRFVAAGQTDALFVTPLTANQVSQDGVANFNILSKLGEDMYPGSQVSA